MRHIHIWHIGIGGIYIFDAYTSVFGPNVFVFEATQLDFGQIQLYLGGKKPVWAKHTAVYVANRAFFGANTFIFQAHCSVFGGKYSRFWESAVIIREQEKNVFWQLQLYLEQSFRLPFLSMSLRIGFIGTLTKGCVGLFK